MDYVDEVKTLASHFMAHLLAGTHGNEDVSRLAGVAFDAAEAFLDEARQRAASGHESSLLKVRQTTMPPEPPRLAQTSDARADERRRRSLMDQALGPARKPSQPPPV
jgi:hypothetical protein